MKNLIAFLLLTGIGASLMGCPARVKLDSNAHAFQANDFTAIIGNKGACVSPPEVGFAYCRLPSGTDAASTSLMMHFPPVMCNKKDAAGNDRIGCINVTVFYTDGGSPYSFVVPFGVTEWALPWSTLLKKPAFEKGDRGFYGVSEEIIFIGEDKKEYSTIVRAEVRLRVYETLVDGKSYTPLQNAEENEAFVWRWKNSEGFNFKMTTSGRSTVIGKPL